MTYQDKKKGKTEEQIGEEIRDSWRKGHRIGDNDEVHKAILDHADVYYRPETGKYTDDGGSEYTLEEAVEQNASNFKSRREFNLGFRNANNYHETLINHQRKNHYKLFGKGKKNND